MAKAIAECTCERCGKAFTKVAFKHNSSAARSFEKWAAENIRVCDECLNKDWQKAQDARNAEAAGASRENGWPELTGTEKQVAWATTLRHDALNEIADQMPDEFLPVFWDFAVEFMNEKRSASWWIDNREWLKRTIFPKVRERMKNPPAAANRAAAAQEAMNDAATIAEPQEKTHEGIVDICVGDTRVSAEYRKNDDFMAIVKGLDYHWDRDLSAWFLPMGVTTGSAEERAAELGNKLLNAGFSIRIQNPETLQNAIHGNYEPRTSRWIMLRTDEEYFTIVWGCKDDLYRQIMSLPGAKYHGSNVTVPSNEYETIIDFAERYDFKFSKGAAAFIKRMKAGTEVVVPEPARNAAYEEHGVEEILNTSREIIDDLRD